jgi:acyl-CoA thioesterase
VSTPPSRPDDATSWASEFDLAVGVRALPDDPTTYAADLDAGWAIGSGINGGLLLALVGNALRSSLPAHPDPLSVSAYYLSACEPGPATVRTQVLRTGRSVSTASASLSQSGPDGREVARISALATYGDLSLQPDDVRTSATPFDLPPVEECVPVDQAPAGAPTSLAQAGLLQRLDLRLDPACLGWAVGKPSGRGVVQGWLRMADPRPPDPILLLLAVDALPPVTFDLGLPGWAPTLELTAHVRARPVPGWLRVRHATRNLAGGLLEEDAEVWDAAGRLVAQSRQLARAPRPV